MTSNVTLNKIKRNSPLTECDNCEDSNVKIKLDDMPDRVIFHPEDLDNNPRADCAIFFPEQTESSSLPWEESEEDSIEPDYLSIVELKSTYEAGSGIKDQIEGAIDFVVDILSRCEDAPWNLKTYCLIPHDTGYKKGEEMRLVKNIEGNKKIFWTVSVNNGGSLREIVNRDVYNEEI